MKVNNLKMKELTLNLTEKRSIFRKFFKKNDKKCKARKTRLILKPVTVPPLTHIKCTFHIIPQRIHVRTKLHLLLSRVLFIYFDVCIFLLVFNVKMLLILQKDTKKAFLFIKLLVFDLVARFSVLKPSQRETF